MKNNSLREVAKFAAGLVAADFLWVLWFSQQRVRTAEFFGITITAEAILPMLIFDIALFLVLVHYGWHIGKIPAMRERTYIFVAGIFFSFIALVHVWHLFSGEDFVLGEWVAPLWLSWFGVAVTSYLAYANFHFVSRMKSK